MYLDFGLIIGIASALFSAGITAGMIMNRFVSKERCEQFRKECVFERKESIKEFKEEMHLKIDRIHIRLDKILEVLGNVEE